MARGPRQPKNFTSPYKIPNVDPLLRTVSNEMWKIEENETKRETKFDYEKKREIVCATSRNDLEYFLVTRNSTIRLQQDGNL